MRYEQKHITFQTGFPITSIREIQMLSTIDHENIVKLEEIVVGKDRDRQKQYVVLRLVCIWLWSIANRILIIY